MLKILFFMLLTGMPDTTSIAWQPGYLDIHHIETGSGNAAFFVMPDGTTMLVDAGDIGDRKVKRPTNPLTSTPPYPNDSKTAGQWIADYIRQVLPAATKPVIDYVMLTHYHNDHIAALPDVGAELPIHKIINRGNFPTDMKQYQSEFLNLQKFMTAQHLIPASLIPGSTKQIVLLHDKASFTSYKVTGVKANGIIWTGKGEQVIEYFNADSILSRKGRFEENTLSLAIKLSYGKFDYFTGGDNTGLQGFGLPAWFDVETPMAKAVGKVEVTTLNHHGCRDAVNENFLRALQPQNVVQQSWSSNHPGEEVLHRLIYSKANVYATNIQEATKATLGFWLTDNYKSTFGHVIIRVLPGGNSYYILIAETIEGIVKVKKVFGPFQCL